LAFYNFDNVSEKSAIHHVLFIGVFLVFIDLINRLTCKISFFYEAMKELGLKLEEKAISYLFSILEYLKSVKLDDEERKSIIEAVESYARES